MNRMIFIAAATLFVVASSHHRIGFAQASAVDSAPGPGSKIVFTSTQHIVPEPPPGLDRNPAAELYIMNGDGTDQQRLTYFPGFKIAAVCSPDGQQIAFHSVTPLASNPLVPTIFLIKVGDSPISAAGQLTEIVSGGSFPSWSPDGKKIVFQSAGRPRDIYVLDLQTMQLTNLTNERADSSDDAWDDYRPDWAPDGHRIAFTSNRGGTREIYVMNVDGSDVMQLTFPGNATMPAPVNMAPDWSPDGRLIVFQSNRDHPSDFDDPGDDPGFEIYVMNADGTAQMRLTDNLSRDLDPAWSPDGGRIIVDSDRDVPQTRQLYVMNADGTHQNALTGPSSATLTTGENSHASWCRGHAAQQ